VLAHLEAARRLRECAAACPERPATSSLRLSHVYWRVGRPRRLAKRSFQYAWDDLDLPDEYFTELEPYIEAAIAERASGEVTTPIE
jgi:hypothetical protein